jgi:flavin-binding protein dodecin
MQQSMASSSLTSGLMGASAASFEEALGDALKNAAKSVSDNLKKK